MAGRAALCLGLLACAGHALPVGRQLAMMRSSGVRPSSSWHSPSHSYSSHPASSPWHNPRPSPSSTTEHATPTPATTQHTPAPATHQVAPTPHGGPVPVYHGAPTYHGPQPYHGGGSSGSSIGPGTAAAVGAAAGLAVGTTIGSHQGGYHGGAYNGGNNYYNGGGGYYNGGGGYYADDGAYHSSPGPGVGAPHGFSGGPFHPRGWLHSAVFWVLAAASAVGLVACLLLQGTRRPVDSNGAGAGSPGPYYAGGAPVAGPPGPQAARPPPKGDMLRAIGLSQATAAALEGYRGHDAFLVVDDSAAMALPRYGAQGTWWDVEMAALRPATAMLLHATAATVVAKTLNDDIAQAMDLPEDAEQYVAAQDTPQGEAPVRGSLEPLMDATPGRPGVDKLVVVLAGAAPSDATPRALASVLRARSPRVRVAIAVLADDPGVAKTFEEAAAGLPGVAVTHLVSAVGAAEVDNEELARAILAPLRPDLAAGLGPGKARAGPGAPAEGGGAAKPPWYKRLSKKGGMGMH